MKTIHTHSFIVNENGERKGGQIICSICGNKEGVRWTKSNRGNNPHKWSERRTCLVCGTTERFLSHGGMIIEQRLAKEGGGEIITNLH